MLVVVVVNGMIIIQPLFLMKLQLYELIVLIIYINNKRRSWRVAQSVDYKAGRAARDREFYEGFQIVQKYYFRGNGLVFKIAPEGL